MFILTKRENLQNSHLYGWEMEHFRGKANAHQPTGGAGELMVQGGMRLSALVTGPHPGHGCAVHVQLI